MKRSVDMNLKVGSKRELRSVCWRDGWHGPGPQDDSDLLQDDSDPNGLGPRIIAGTPPGRRQLPSALGSWRLQNTSGAGPGLWRWVRARCSIAGAGPPSGVGCIARISTELARPSLRRQARTPPSLRRLRLRSTPPGQLRACASEQHNAAALRSVHCHDTGVCVCARARVPSSVCVRARARV